MTDPGSEPLVRAARVADLPRLMRLLHQLSLRGERPEAVAHKAGERHRAALAEVLADPRYHLLVLEDAARVQGTCVLYVLPGLAHGASPWGVVENVVVEEAARGRGYGELLMAEAVKLAWDAGCYKVSLLSNLRRNDAHRFYERIGFQNSHKGFTRYFSER
ncbi:MAG: GNAT family N-acetyltransferase [Dehalococcoidia bacterium]